MGAGAGRAEAMGEAWCGEAGRWAASEWASVARFCHLIHIITGVSLLYGGGELNALVTVSWVPPLPFSLPVADINLKSSVSPILPL